MDLQSWDGVSTLLGAIIGAGVLGLPYVFAQAGVLPGIITILVLGAALLALNLMVGEVALRTRADHQLAGYARLYAGPTAGMLMTVSLLIGIYGALVAYAIGMGESLQLLIGGSKLVWMVVVFVVMALLLAQRLKVIEESERYLTPAKIFFVVLVSAICVVSGRFSTANLPSTSSWTLPFGVVLFSLLGTAAIPEVREELKGNLRKLKGVLVWSSVIAVSIYLLFATTVVGVTGAQTSEIATLSLGEHLGQAAIILLNIFALLAMASAFLALGEALKKTFEEDYRWKPVAAWALTLGIPALIMVTGVQSFITVIGVTGAFAGGIDGIIIVLMYRSALKNGNRRPEYRLDLPLALQLAIAAVFVLALVWAVTQTLALWQIV